MIGIIVANLVYTYSMAFIDKYNKHIKSITPLSQREFTSLFDDFQQLSGKKYFEDFEKQYNIWQEKKNV